MKALYSIEYRDADGFLEIKKAFLTDGELQELMDGFNARGVEAKVYRNSPGPMPDLSLEQKPMLRGSDPPSSND